MYFICGHMFIIVMYIPMSKINSQTELLSQETVHPKYFDLYCFISSIMFSQFIFAQFKM